MNKKTVAVSKCLLGCNCRYDGGNNLNEKVVDFIRDKNVLEICPEVFGGMPTPREPSEIVLLNNEKRVVSKSGDDVSEFFYTGAYASLKLALESGVTLAVLKESSPSCGANNIYDGTFTDTKISGSGITAEIFRANGITVISEKEL